MARSLPPLNGLRAFEAAARYLSFTRAADELHVTQAAVSHQVKALEARLGVRLFQRLTRSLRLTDEGQALLPDVRDAFDRLSAAVGRLSQRDARVRLTVSVLTTFALSWLVPRLPRFNARHPEIEVSLIATPRLTDFAREDVDVAIRYGTGPWPGLRRDRLLDEGLTPLCGQRWIKKLKRPDDLARVPLLLPVNAENEDWEVWLREAGLPQIDTRKGTAFDSTRIAVDAAIAGAGVAIGNPYVHAEPIEEGRLFQPFDLVVPNGRAYWLVCPETTAERPKIKAFRDWITEETALRPPVPSRARKRSGRARAALSRRARTTTRGTGRDDVSGD
ncbi:MAG: transcriptional regulator GcvA [Alphaproteobacteria bacterium]|nr:transcriptional regulator GcvA [Alphaproteobacteria bacterium]